MTDHLWSKFWWKDWQGDSSLRMCSIAARGLWMELLCIAHEATPKGHVLINGLIPSMEDLSQLTGVKISGIQKLLHELEKKGVFSRTENGVIFSRRMVRDSARSEEGKYHISKRYPNPKPPGPSGSPRRYPASLPTREPRSLEAEADTEAEKAYKASLRNPPAGQSRDARTQGVVVSLAKTLRHVEYAPGWSPSRSPTEQVETVIPSRPKTAHLTPEQLAIARKKA